MVAGCTSYSLDTQAHPFINFGDPVCLPARQERNWIMLTDQQLRLRADYLRQQLDQTMRCTQKAIRVSADLTEDARESRRRIKGHLAISAQHLRASRDVLGGEDRGLRIEG